MSISDKKWDIFAKHIAHIADLMKDHWQTVLERCDRPKELSIDFLPEADRILGGLKKKKLVIVGGRTGMGKSVFMLNLASAFASQRKKIIFFSFEMTKEICFERIISAHLEIDNRLIAGGEISKQINRNIGGIREKISAFYDELEKQDFIIVESIGTSLPDFKEIMTVIPDGPPDVVFIDYGNMVEAQSNRTKKESLDEYITGLRAFAVKNNICVILGAQINRQTHKGNQIRPPQIWELKDTGELEQIADVIFLLHWEYFYGRALKEEKNTYIINVAKNRDGRTGVIYCSFFPQFSRITEKKSTDLVY